MILSFQIFIRVYLDETISYVTGEMNGYYFVDSRVGQAEFNVILAE